MALFGGAHMEKREALILPLAAMVISDLLIGFDSIPMRMTVYGSFLAIVFIGSLLKKSAKAPNVASASLASSLLFFLTTNFAVWAQGNMYPKTAEGLASAYYYAIPFFRNTILGDLFFTGLFFGAYYLLLNAGHSKARLKILFLKVRNLKSP